MKRILSILLSIVICLPVMTASLTSCYAATSYTAGDYTYEIISSAQRTVRITKYSGSDTVVDIPDIINDKYKVTEIGYNCFSKSTIVSIDIPAYVTGVDPYALNSTGLAEITVDSDNQSYLAAAGVLYTADMRTIVRCPSAYSTESFVIPDGVRTIEAYAFAILGKSSAEIPMTRIKIPYGVESIGRYAFYGSAFTEIIVPDSVVDIGASAFLSSKVKTLYLGSGLQTLGSNQFSTSSGSTYSGITTLEVSEENDIFSSVDNVLLGNYGHDLIFYPKSKINKSYTVPDSVTTIKDCAFAFLALDCIDLNNVSKLEGDAFFNVSIGKYILSEELGRFYTIDNRNSFEICVLNPECAISFHTYSQEKYTVKIYGYIGSTAETFVNEKTSDTMQLTFVSIDGQDSSVYHLPRPITFGSYPQKRVVSPALVSKLNALDVDWHSYGYYSGDCRIGSQKQGDYMQMADVEYNGSRYRGVRIDDYRPIRSYLTHTSNYSYQDDNGYIAGETYWFRYSPLRWDVLDGATGLVVSTDAIDAQSFSDMIYEYSGAYYSDPECTYQLNDYYYASVRQWLNNDFCSTAFTDDERACINTTQLTCGARTAFDKVFLLPYDDVVNNGYGFTTDEKASATRYAVASDYAQCQGVQVKDSANYYKNNAAWLLRSSGSGTDMVCNVTADGKVADNHSAAGSDGIRPAMRLSTVSGKEEDEGCSHTDTRLLGYRVSDCTAGGYTGDMVCTICNAVLTKGTVTAPKQHSYSELESVQPTCTSTGSVKYICESCGDIYTRQLDMTEHIAVVDAGTEPTCTQTGLTDGSHCRTCGIVLVEQQVIPALEHDMQHIETEATCTASGSVLHKCSRCSYEYTTTLPKKAHTPMTDRAVAPTYDSTGLTEGSHCAVCNAVIVAQTVVPRLVCDHKSRSTTVITKATMTSSGKCRTVCTTCGKVLSTFTVKPASSFSVSGSMLTYTGKAISKPTVTVRDSSGKKLAAKYYTVRYISRSTGKTVTTIKAIGQYKIKITLKGRYSGTKYLYFTVKPKTNAITTISTAKNAVSLKWKKDKAVTGYQVIIATDSSFTKGKRSVKLTKNTAVSYTFSKLKKGIRYYVKVRPYKNVKVDGKKATIYGSYSKTRSILCK